MTKATYCWLMDMLMVLLLFVAVMLPAALVIPTVVLS